jgi:zinc protease
LAELEAAAGKAGVELPSVVQRSLIPLIHMKLLFAVGSAQDPPGKEGLASLAASMIADAGSRQLRIDEIEKAFYPMAASFSASIDKEMTVFTGVVHKDNWEKFLAIALPMLLDPGFRSEDFTRLQQQQLNTLKVDLRSDDEEELGKIRLEANIFAGTRYAHPVLGTVAGLGAITLDDVKAFVRDRYSRSRLTLGVAGQSPETLLARLERELAGLPAGGPPAAVQVAGRSAKGIEVEIIQKETRAAAISFGFPIEVTRSHPDFAALSVARAWLGEHRSSMSHLFQRIREVRGMNYGDYAYIEAFPDGGSRLFPPANVARQAQIFQVWIRPVLPQNAHMALRIAIWELAKLIENGLSEKEFTETRDYLSKNVFLLTATQDQQLGYALDSRWYGIGQYTAFLRERLAKLTREDVHRAIRRHLASKDLSVVIVTRDAEALRENLVSDAFSPITYDAPKPQLAEEDRVIGSLRLHIRPDAVRVTPVDEVFAR